MGTYRATGSKRRFASEKRFSRRSKHRKRRQKKTFAGVSDNGKCTELNINDTFEKQYEKHSLGESTPDYQVLYEDDIVKQDFCKASDAIGDCDFVVQNKNHIECDSDSEVNIIEITEEIVEYITVEDSKEQEDNEKKQSVKETVKPSRIERMIAKLKAYSEALTSSWHNNKNANETANISRNDNETDNFSRNENKTDHLNINENETDNFSRKHDEFVRESNDVREIIQFNYFSDELTNIIYEHAKLCDSRLRCTSRHYKGLMTKFCYECKVCNYKIFICSENPDQSEKMGINTSAVLGTINIGIGSTQLTELLAAMNIKCMSDNTYRKYQELVLDIVQSVTHDNMKSAGEEEKRLAIENKQLHNEIPWISVVSDGSWMTRSYGSNYDSLSGLAVIIGLRTGKVLYIGVRNKYCSTCEYAQRNEKQVKAHTCYKNFDRNDPSTAMESDAILEGFKSSIETHGLIYKILVTDGDSSVYKTIIDNNVYKDYDLIPERIRCYNHLQRNLYTKLITVSKTTQPRGSNKLKNFYTLRNLVKGNILSIRQLVEESVDYRKAETKDRDIRKEDLRQDILNIPCHIFGDHKACRNRAYTCYEKDKPINERERNNIPDLEVAGFYQKIEEAIIDISKHSNSLLCKLTNNVAESFNAIVCVDIGGKRVNYALKSQYLTRAYAAVLRFNTQQFLTEVYDNVCDNVPPLIQNMDMKRQQKVARTRMDRNLNGRKRRFTSKNTAGRHYGKRSQKVDICEKDFQILRENHYKKLTENQQNWIDIEQSTRGQHDCPKWVFLRKQMCTASHFGAIIRSKDSTSCAQRVKNIVYPSINISEEMQYGLDREPEIIKELESILSKKIRRSGLWIDKKHACLGCTPDGIIEEDGLAEVKCSLHAAKMTAEEAIKTVKNLKTIFKKKKDTYEMNKNHHYYYQVQGQLHITQRLYCIFAFWTPKSMIHIRVEKDDKFWETKMEPFLLRFYENCVLPEIIDSRDNRNMPIREPDYILLAKETKKRRESQKVQENSSICNKRKINVNGKEKKAKLIQDKKINEDNAAKKIKNAQSSEDDIVLVAHNQNSEWTERDNEATLTFIESREITINMVMTNVLPVESLLNDDSLDAFVRVVEKSGKPFYIQSVLYMQYPQLVHSVEDGKGVAIIGGTCTGHWRVAYYNGEIIKLYDTLMSYSNGKVHDTERQYLNKRFPNGKTIEYQEMAMQQPDGTSCGVYCAAIIVDILLDVNPSNERYTLNTVALRQHLVNIIINNRIAHFPKQ